MLAALKNLMARIKGSESKDVVEIFKKAKDERQVLVLLKEARKRDVDRRQSSNDRLNSISHEEEVLMNEGRDGHTSEGRKKFLARRIKELREEAKSIMHKVDKIYGPRLKTLEQHIQSLETVIEVKSEPLPSLISMEETAVRAKTMMGDLDQALELAHGIGTPKSSEGPDPEERGILDEMEALRQKDIDDKERGEERALEKDVKIAVKSAKAKKECEYDG